MNFETNFFTDVARLTHTVTLLGRRVDIRTAPARYTWLHGDGTSNVTMTPGARYPDLEVTHSYRTAEQVRPSVDVTYTAEYRVDGGPWAPVPGSVTIPGDPVDLDVVEARPRLVGTG